MARVTTDAVTAAGATSPPTRSRRPPDRLRSWDVPAAADRTARIASEVFAPAVLVAGLMLAVGWHAGEQPGVSRWWGLPGALFAAGIPLVYVLRGVRQGRLSSHHIPEREHRGGVAEAEGSQAQNMRDRVVRDLAHGDFRVHGELAFKVGGRQSLGCITSKPCAEFFQPIRGHR